MAEAASAPAAAGRLAAGAPLRLVLEARALTGRWHVTSHLRRDRTAWPPAPDTAFSALVAAAAAAGRACDPALYWLESLEVCSVEAEAGPGQSATLVHVPVADQTMWAKGARQPRHICSAGSEAPVRWSWALPDDPPPERIARIAEIAVGITHIGAARGPVLASAYVTRDPASDHALVPVRGGRLSLRTPFPGRLDALEAAYLRGQWPPVAPEQAFDRVSAVVRCPKTGQFRLSERLGAPWSPMLVLRKASGPRLDLAATAPLCAALRRNLLACLDVHAPAALTGHAPGGAPTEEAHLAIAPLARVGDRYADGEILGLGLLTPRDLDDEAHGQLIGALGEWLRSGGNVSLGDLAWRLVVAPEPDRARPIWSLDPKRYEGRATTWTTVTPAVLDRHPKWHADGRPKRGRSVLEIVAAMCRAVGLPPPAAAGLLSGPPHVGAAPWTEHALDGRAYLSSGFLAHLRIRWEQPTPGPILLGRGRHFGMGLMLPERTDSRHRDGAA